MTREEAMNAILEDRSFRIRALNGWERTVTILELQEIPLAEAAITRVSSHEFFQFEPMCWSCKYTATDTFADGRKEDLGVAYCTVVMPLALPTVVD